MGLPDYAVSASPEPIAIVGIGCRFPGKANTPSRLWDVLREPPNTAKEIPVERFNLDRFYHPDGSHHGTCNVKETYFLDEDIRYFDAGFFGVPPSEAAAMDPQHRILMETVYEAMESAGLAISHLQGSDTAVYVGVMCSDYYILAAQDFNVVPTYNSTGIANSNASARLSYFFDWHGPCMTIDTACSSSLVALHQAVQVLRAGTSRIAVAAGTNLVLAPLGYISESTLGMLSPSGRCQMWDANADGYARGEGVAAVMLKRLSDAIADGDQIECIIRETGVNQDGKTMGITMPSAITQAALIRDTYARAGLDLNEKRDRPQYFEAHGTGTPAGDPQEAEALHTAFFSTVNHSSDEVLRVGSVKTVIGHTEGTAGLAGIIKAYLAIKHGVIPPNLHFNNLSPSVEPFYGNLRLVTSPEPWPVLPEGVPRRVSVNSFGFGGTNAHAILESYGLMNQQDTASEQTRIFLPFNFSATSEKSLRALLESYLSYLETATTVNLRGLAYTLACRRSAFQYKISFSAQTQRELCSKIGECLARDSSPFNTLSVSNVPRMLGVFTGQGAQWPQMGAELIRSSSYARTIIEELDQSLADLPEADRPQWIIWAELQADSSASRLGEAAVAQTLTCAVQIVLVDLLRSAGIKFQSIVGHSSGEIAAAYAAGFLSRRDAIRIAYYRGFHSKLAEGPSGQQGRMIAVGTSYEDAMELCALEDFDGRVVVAASNSSTSVTISGDIDAIEEVKAILEEEGKFVRSLRVDKAYHSHHMKAVSEPFLNSLRTCNIQILTPAEGSPTWFSSVHQATIVKEDISLQGQYWVDNLNSPVLFMQALETACRMSGPFDMGLEVGPHPALKGPASDVIEHLTGSAFQYAGCLTRGNDDVDSFSSALGAIWTVLGPARVDFEQFQRAIYDDAESIHILDNLPTYPWNHDRVLWSESRLAKLLRQQDGRFHDILGTREADGTQEEWRWRNVLTPKELPWLTDHALQGQTVFPATGYFCLALEAAMQIAGQRSVQLLELSDMHARKAITIDETAGTEILVSITKIKQTEQEITASFACFSTISRDALQLALNATGDIKISLGTPVLDILAPRAPPVHGMQPADTANFYNEVAEIGYNYGPKFRGITSLERKLGSSRGTIVGPPNDETGTVLLFHPGMLDAALQGMLASFSSPGDGRLWSLHAPSKIRRVTLVPSLCGLNMTKEVSFDSAVDNLTGDVEVFQSDTGYKSISVEGVSFVPFTVATEANDRHLFAQEVWNVNCPDGDLALGSRRATPEEIQKGIDAERVAFYYLRTLHETISEEERITLKLPSHHEALLDFVRHIYDIVERDEHAYVRRQWMNDTYQEICEIMARYGPKDSNFLLAAATGENLAAVVRGQTTILEHMTKDDKLDNYYRSALGFADLNELIATMVGQIAHRYPHMNICEVGAGTGGASRSILAKLGTAFSSYTYTDISSGFFNKAQQNLAAYKDRMIYKTLDITQSPIDQGFIKGAYDLVIAANVLHATPDLEETLQNVRRLLKPGGYLVMIELIDNDIMRVGLMFGGLPGWWVGRDTGRKYSPCVGLGQWHDLLLKSGFGGADSHTPLYNPVVLPTSIIVAQAVDNEFTVLRSPLSAAPERLSRAKSSHLVILGGKGEADKLVYQLGTYYSRIIRASDWEDLDVISIPASCSFLNFSDLDCGFWKDITASRLEKLKVLLMAAVNVLWVTWGARRDNGDGAMTLGFFRSLFCELPETQLQILDLEDRNEVPTSSIAEMILRLEVTAQWKKSGLANSSRLWTTEPELRVQQGRVLIPRVLPEKAQNDRYNSAKRTITKEIHLLESIVTLNWNGTQYSLREEETPRLPSVPGCRRIRVDSSLLSSIVTPKGRLFFSLGTDMETGERVLSVSTKNASAILVPADWSVAVAVGRSIDAQYLSYLSSYLISQNVLAMIPPGATVVIHEANPGLASMLSRQLTDQDSRVLFTTAYPGVVKRNWVSIHPRLPDRNLRALIPKEASVYIDLSSAVSASAESIILGSRIAEILPHLCDKQSASVVIARESTELYVSDNTAVQQLLDKANSFTAAQVNDIPDGMLLPTVPLGHIVRHGMSFEMMSVVHWHDDTTVPVIVEQIINRRDLFLDDKTYWLVGLAGDLGRSLCDFMVTRGARHIVLTSRNPKVDSQWVEDFAAQGVTVSYIAADITSKVDLQRANEQIVRTMPPIAGVANGALLLRDRVLINMDVDTFHANTRPKVEGTIYLDELFPSNTLDFFIAFSSVTSIIGYIGQTAYTAANTFMKALISQRRHRGLAGSVIDISQVFGVGYMERGMKLQHQLSPSQVIRPMSGSGTMIMSEPDLHQLFAEAIVAGRAGSDADPELITGVETITSMEAKEVTWGRNPRLGHFVRDAGGAAILPSATKTAAAPVKMQLEAAKDVEEISNILKAAFGAKLSSSLLMNDEAISVTTPLIDLGVDSLVAVEIRTWFAHEVGADVAVLKILGGSSIQDLVDDTMIKLDLTFQQEAQESDKDTSTAISNDHSTESLAADDLSSRSSVGDDKNVVAENNNSESGVLP